MTIAVHRVPAANAGPMTLRGTNTYVIASATTAWIVDPGPRDRAHAQAVVDQVVATGVRAVGGIIATHHHSDHTDGIGVIRRALSTATGHTVPLWAADPGLVPGAATPPSELAAGGERAAEIIHTPGHTGDGLSILVEGGRLLAGDLLLGDGSSTVIMPDGSLADLLQSLEVLRVMALDGSIASLHPGHGNEIDGPHAVHEAIEHQLAHRRRRIDEVRALRERGTLQITKIVDTVYGQQLAAAPAADRDALRQAATYTVRATLAYLTEQERV